MVVVEVADELDLVGKSETPRLWKYLAALPAVVVVVVMERRPLSLEAAR